MFTCEAPLVSVIIPVYNRPSVINTIYSICNQTYKNLEIIVVDNASTDSTVAMIKTIKDDRIRLFINESNMGQTLSMNRGLSEARGKYIARIDSDDIALPERIEKQVDFMENHKDYVLVGSWVRYISDNDRLGMIVRMPTTDEGMRFMHTFACGMFHPSAMYRRDTIVENGIKYNPEIHMAEDYNLWVDLMKHGKACNLGEPLIYYRRGNNNDSRKYQELMSKESTDIRLRVCTELEIDEEKRRSIIKEIELEKKSNKSMIDCLKIFRFLKKSIKENINNSSIDYQIINTHIKLKVYGTCFATNSAWYALIVRKVYKFARDWKNFRGVVAKEKILSDKDSE